MTEIKIHAGNLKFSSVSNNPTGPAPGLIIMICDIPLGHITVTGMSSQDRLSLGSLKLALHGGSYR